MYQFSNAFSDVSITLIDGKNDGYEQFEGCQNFYAGDNCVAGINYYFDSIFQYKRNNKQDKEFKKIKHILVIDELSSILQDIPPKEAEAVKSKISRISKLGRSLNCFVWVGVQKAYSELFGQSRENFTVIIGLGNLDSSQKQMLFERYKEKLIRECGQSQGYIYISGQGLSELEVAHIQDINKLNEMITKALNR